MAQSGTTMPEYQNDLISYVQNMMKTYEPERLVSMLMGPSRRHGKSHAAKMMQQAYTTNRSTTQEATNSAAGFKGDMALLDEFDQLAHSYVKARVSVDEFSALLPKEKKLDLSVVHTVEDPKWPGAEITVREVQIDVRDPRNSNPTAGRQRRYEIRGEYTITETVQGLEFAKRRAGDLHKVAIQRLLEDRRKEQPTFGRF